MADPPAVRLGDALLASPGLLGLGRVAEVTVRCCPPHSCPYGFRNALADAGRWPPPAVPVSAQASLRLRAGFMLPVRVLATATAALGFMALNIKRRGNKTERVKSSPLIYTVSYKLERMGHGAALSARDPLHSSRPQGRGGCPVRRTASGVGRERSRAPSPSCTELPLFLHGFCAQLCLELPKVEDRALRCEEPRDPLPGGLVLGSALWEFQLH